MPHEPKQNKSKPSQQRKDTPQTSLSLLFAGFVLEAEF